MDDLFDRLEQLSLERKALDEQINALWEQRAQMEARIRETAALLVSTPTAPVVAERRPPEDFGDIQKRQRELLGVLRANPGQHSDYLAKVMYGATTTATKRSVSAYFSRLKARGYVEPIGPGRFQLTAKGEAAAISP